MKRLKIFLGVFLFLALCGNFALAQQPLLKPITISLQDLKYDAVTTATAAAAFTVDWTANYNHQVTITGTTLDITFTNPPGPCRLILKIIQGDGADTIDWTNEADLKFPGGVDPVLSLGAGDIDVLYIWWDGTEYVGVMNYDFD